MVATLEKRETRSATGSSQPRKMFTFEPTTTTTRKPKTKTTAKSTGKPKANMSKPRAKATTGGRVEKKTPAKKKKTTVGDKVKGLVEKAEGKVERKPGKKAAGTKKIKGTESKGRPKKATV